MNVNQHLEEQLLPPPLQLFSLSHLVTPGNRFVHCQGRWFKGLVGKHTHEQDDQETSGNLHDFLKGADKTGLKRISHMDKHRLAEKSGKTKLYWRGVLPGTVEKRLSLFGSRKEFRRESVNH